MTGRVFDRRGHVPLRQQLARAYQVMLDLLFPPRCVGCSCWGDWFCDTCLGEIRRPEPPLCRTCGREIAEPGLCAGCCLSPPPIDGIRAPAFLDGPLRKAIHAFKYDGLRALSPALGRILTEYWLEHPLPADVIVPVPLHPSRQRRRGYNQSSLLARELAKASGVPMDEHCLRRTRPTRPQVGLNAQQRQNNVAGAFLCVDDRVANQRILLIDDVCTTASTLIACATTLRSHGALSVWGLTLARDHS